MNQKTNPPFKQGDWLVTRQESADVFDYVMLHRAISDPVPSDSIRGGWGYVVSTDPYRRVSPGHFRKATRDDIREESHRLRNEAQKLISQAEMIEHDMDDLT